MTEIATHHRLAEVLAALSLASDLGLGAPLERGLRASAVGSRLAELAGLELERRRRLYYTGFVIRLGCTSTASQTADMFGDELATDRALSPLVMGPPADMMSWVFRNAGAGRPPLRRALKLGAILAAGPGVMKEQNAEHCEVARVLAGRLGLEPEIGPLLDFVFERWDGRGGPAGARGEAIPLEMRIGHVAYDVTAHAVAGFDAETIAARLRHHAGRGLDPALAAVAIDNLPELLELATATAAWDAAMAAEPGPPTLISEAGIDGAAQALADFVDLKFGYARGHSRAVAELAAGAALELGLPAEEVATVRQAGLVHDLGTVTVSNSTWERPGPLSDSEWEQVRLHAHWTERALGRVPAFKVAAALAGLHHERLDGSGYHRGGGATTQPAAARVLAVAEVARSLSEWRPYREGLGAAEASAALDDAVRAGKLDADAAAAVARRLGLDLRGARPPAPADLTERELEVLRLIARGQATKQVAAALGISPKTADHHLQSIYGKTGIRTRAGVAVFAMEHGLV